MNWFKNLKMRTKLLLAFGVLCALLVGLAAVAYTTLTAFEKDLREVVDPSHRALEESLSVRAHQNRIRGTMLELLLAQDTATRASARREIEERMKDVESGLARIKAYLLNRGDTEDLATFDDVLKDIAAYREGRDEEFKLADAGKRDEAIAMGAGVQNRRFERIREAMLKLGDGMEKRANAAVAECERMLAEAVRVFVAATVLAVLFALFMVWLMNRLIAAPMQLVTGVAGRVAAGDLTMKIEAKDGARSDEVGALQQAFSIMIEKLQSFAQAAARVAAGDLTVQIQAADQSKDVDTLQQALRAMIESLRDTHRELRQGFSVLASSSTEILATVSQVAASASETATAVSETSTTAEEVKQTAHLSNQKAKAVQETALRTAAVSETGRQAVTATIEGMNRIREQMESIAESVVRLSEQGQTIGEIIATVNDLAEQSNLLAVNAAIEATRAGEYGKGFGVVAQEVKSLAEQSRQATTQVRTILMEVQKATSAAVMATEQGTKAVAAGVKQATDAGDSIKVLTGSVSEAAQAATQIAASSQQQLVGMDQIAQAIASIKQATTQNMAGTKQLEASAQGLQDLGGRLKVLVERQRVEA
jgi:methyl-accepting chemotaxis protein